MRVVNYYADYHEFEREVVRYMISKALKVRGGVISFKSGEVIEALGLKRNVITRSLILHIFRDICRKIGGEERRTGHGSRFIYPRSQLIKCLWGFYEGEDADNLDKNS